MILAYSSIASQVVDNSVSIVVCYTMCMRGKYDEGQRRRQRLYMRRLRLEALEKLGGKCVSCGFSDKRALQIDHINGGGSKERKEIGFNGKFHIHVIREAELKSGKYQLLCANCNWIKRVEEREHSVSYSE